MELERITQYVLYVGLNDKDVKRQIVPTDIAEEIAMETIGDCSIERIRGCYTHENGKRVYENTLKISILFRSDEEIARYIDELKHKLNQESIAVMRNSVESALM